MKKLIFSVALLSAALSASAEDHPLWMRYPAISPDGTTIAFAYKGDLYSVSVNGGEARQLTTHAAFDSHPVWSPDSKKIAFQSNREGSLDIFVIDAKGGAPTRLTTNSGSETPIAFADNDHVLYSASLQPTAQSIIFGDNTFPQIYKVSTKGGRPELFSTLTMEDISKRNGRVYHYTFPDGTNPPRITFKLDTEKEGTTGNKIYNVTFDMSNLKDGFIPARWYKINARISGSKLGEEPNITISKFDI